MNYIVFDLEWNQSPFGKKYSDRRLPFEIIEIGAVKMNMDLEIIDTFHSLIKPSVYKWIHNNIHDVIHVDYKDLKKGRAFPEAAQEFLSWAGKDGEWCFCTWGDQDLTELQRNLAYYKLLPLIKGPVVYLDAQKLFALEYETYSVRRSLEYAIDFLHIKKDHGFHRALDDARFTADILQHLTPQKFPYYVSIDAYQHPVSRKTEFYAKGPDHIKYVSREYPSREQAMHDREVSSTPCPLCSKFARRKIRWFSVNNKLYYCTSFCPDHGEITGKIRFKKVGNDQYFAVKTVRISTKEQKEEILLKKDLLRQKKLIKKSQ